MNLPKRIYGSLKKLKMVLANHHTEGTIYSVLVEITEKYE